MLIGHEALDEAANVLLDKFKDVFADEPVHTESFSVDARLKVLHEAVYTAVRILHTPDRTAGLRIVSRFQAATSYRRAKPMPHVLSEYQRAVLRRYLWIAEELNMGMIALPNARSLAFRLESKDPFVDAVCPTSVELLFSLDDQPVFRTVCRDAA